jgi:hypothetical protein
MFRLTNTTVRGWLSIGRAFRIGRGFATKVSKMPAFHKNKPIAEVLKECRPLSTKMKLEKHLKVLEDFDIDTANDWLELSDKGKLKIEDHAA